MTLEPGHFHAALVQKTMVPGVHPRIYVYGSLSQELIRHLNWLRQFNSRRQDPTSWQLDVRTGDNWRERAFREQPGNTAIIAGPNRTKIDLLLDAVQNGLHAVVDKPWIIEAEDFPKLEQVFYEADLRDLIVWDMMTERHVVTNQLQRELIGDTDVFGHLVVGSPTDPTLTLESVHYIKKTVDSVALQRPSWWFDPVMSGESLTDVGTHLADLALWLLFPEQAISHQTNIAFLDASAWPTPLSFAQFREATGLAEIPKYLDHDGQVLYSGNGHVTFTVKGAHVRLSTLWDYENVSGSGDTHESIARGSKSRIAVRQDGSGPQLFVAANGMENHEEVGRCLERKCRVWQLRWPGVSILDLGQQFQIVVPASLMLNHEALFGKVLEEFITAFHNPRMIPSWERTNLLTKYYITTQAVALAHAKRA
jgi:predicted dehydrogenase